MQYVEKSLVRLSDPLRGSVLNNCCAIIHDKC